MTSKRFVSAIRWFGIGYIALSLVFAIFGHYDAATYFMLFGWFAVWSVEKEDDLGD